MDLWVCFKISEIDKESKWHKLSLNDYIRERMIWLDSSWVSLVWYHLVFFFPCIYISECLLCANYCQSRCYIGEYYLHCQEEQFLAIECLYYKGPFVVRTISEFLIVINYLRIFCQIYIAHLFYLLSCCDWSRR